MNPEVDDIWTVRVFRDPETELKIFRIFAMKNMSMGVVDVNEQIKHTPQGDIERVHWYNKSDLQFLDLLIRPVKKEAANEDKGSEEVRQPDRQPNPPAGGRGQPGDDAGVRQERNRKDGFRR